MSYELKISAKDRAAGRFIGSVKKELMRAAFTEKENSRVTQQSIAAKLGVNRSVIHRMLKGETNLTLRSVAEIAWALGWVINFSLSKRGVSVSSAPSLTEGRGILFPPHMIQVASSDDQIRVFEDAA